MQWLFKTESGSSYLVRETEGRWFLAAQEVAVKENWPKDFVIEVYAPISNTFPPVVGKRQFFQAKGPAKGAPKTHSAVLPYNVLITAPVISWDELP